MVNNENKYARKGVEPTANFKSEILTAKQKCVFQT